MKYSIHDEALGRLIIIVSQPACHSSTWGFSGLVRSLSALAILNGHPEAGCHDGADLRQIFLELVAPQIGVQRGQEGVTVLLGHTQATTL